MPVLRVSKRVSIHGSSWMLQLFVSSSLTSLRQIRERAIRFAGVFPIELPGFSTSRPGEFPPDTSFSSRFPCLPNRKRSHTTVRPSFGPRPGPWPSQ